MANYGDATNLGVLYWGQEDSQYELSFDPILNPLNPETISADASFGSGTCNLSKSYSGPTFASCQPLTPSSPAESHRSNFYFSLASPPQDSNEIIVQSGCIGRSESMGIDSAGVTPAPAKRTALTQLPQKSNTGITNINDYYDGIHAKIKCILNTPIDPKLRSASRKPKRSQIKRAFPINTKRAPECHNNIEKQYRTRLRLRFERLLMVLHTSRREEEGSEEGKSLQTGHCISRGEVLDAARQRILTLEEENKRLLCKTEGLSRDLAVS